jgi:hypothetical protein
VYVPGKYMAFHRVYECPSYVVKEYALFQMTIHKFCKLLKIEKIQDTNLRMYINKDAFYKSTQTTTRSNYSNSTSNSESDFNSSITATL